MIFTSPENDVIVNASLAFYRIIMKAKYLNFKNKQLHQVKENAAQSQHYNAQSKRPRPRKAKKKMNCSYKNELGE